MISTLWPQTLACPPWGTTGLGGWSGCYHDAYCFAGGGGGTAGSGLGKVTTACPPTARAGALGWGSTPAHGPQRALRA